MNRQQAQKIIQDTFEKPFDMSGYIGFIKNLLNKIDEATFTYQGNYIPDAFKEYIKTLKRIGKFSDGENSIDIVVITLQKDRSLDRARTMQRNFIAWYLNGSRGGMMKDAALVAYVSPNKEDWRFSLVKMDYTFEKTKTGRIKVKEEFTPARRWSFLVGANEKSHTAQSRLVNILANDEQAPTLEEIEKAFDIEIVTKEFFLKYRELFLRTKEELDRVVERDPKIKADLDRSGVDTVNFAKKLLGQIVFLYFLQKKGWFGVGRDNDWGTGSKHFLRELFEKKHSEYKNFYNDILEPLFYEALRIDRNHDDGYYSRFNCKIPFLNGGLFDPIGNHDWVHTDINISDKLFSNTEKTKEGDTGNGILDIFDRYNFTVKEDEPLDKEVAIDPELLGKAYEKFNAIRPDNYEEFNEALKSGKKGEENKFNRKFGVYYTPRKIVHYMCQQSMINYLATELEGKINKEDIETLIYTGEQVSENELRVLRKGKETSTYSHKLPENIRKNAALIDEKLSNITICDPAVGSGAFPVGMMSEIARMRNVLTDFIKYNTRTPYEFKRRCIEHSLYGVDIDPGAVEIAKLRLWLSLIVDEDDISNIKPLPNLDYKIVCGNSLLGVGKDLLNAHLYSELEKLKPLFFNETNPTNKHFYKQQIDNLISQITTGHKAFDFEVYFSEVFHYKGGFDLVIANPPYITYHGRRRRIIKKQELEYFRKNYDCVLDNKKDGKFNSAMFFIEKFVKISNASGLICCITDISFYEHFYKGLKKYLLENTKIHTIVNGLSCFDNVASGQLIIIATKTNNINDALGNIVKIYDNGIDSKVTIMEQTLWHNRSNDYQFIIPDKNFDSLSKKFEESNKSMEYYYPYKLIRTGESIGVKEKGFIIDKRMDNSKVPIYKYLEGSKSVPAKYSTPKPTRYFRFDVDLLNRRNIAYRKDAIRNKRKNPKVLGMGDKKAFDNPKILIRQSCDHLCCTYTDSPCVYNRSYYSISNENSSGKSQINLFYVLALLNSKLFSYYARKKRIIRMEVGKQPQIRLKDIKGLSIKMVPEDQQKPYIKIVNSILSITKTIDYRNNQQMQEKVNYLEREIDQMVYQLYSLTMDEIGIVESDNKYAD